jgi:hypothetical protein
MPDQLPYTWKPDDVIEVTNVSHENILLELDSGLLRLDIGRTLRLTASTLKVAQLNALVNAGQVKVKPYRWK